MMRITTIHPVALICLLGLVAASPVDDGPPLPPGWTEADVMAYIEASTPGPMHHRLTQGAGTWHGKNSNWMSPDGEPIVTESITTVTPVMGGRYVQIQVAGEMPGMEDYRGMGLFGYNNVAKQFTCVWIDNRSTGMMTGTGSLSDDGSTLTWDFGFHCPITGEPAAFRQIETITGPDTKRLELHGSDPKTGQQFKMMVTELTRQKADTP